MKNRDVLGQEVVEFALISVLVLLSSLLVLIIFGNKISYFFSDISSAKKAADLPSKSIDPNNTTLLVNNNFSVLTTATTNNVLPSNNLNITNNPDGSTSFTVAGKNYSLNSTVISNIDQVMQTSAGSGKTELIKEIAALIAKYQQAYPNQPVPDVKLDFGTSSISENNGTNYNGTAMNTTTIKVGELFVVIQKDNSGGTCVIVNPSSCIQRKIEGTVPSGGNTFNGSISYFDGSNYGNTVNIAGGSINIDQNTGVLSNIASGYGSNNTLNINFSQSYNITQ